MILQKQISQILLSGKRTITKSNSFVCLSTLYGKKELTTIDDVFFNSKAVKGNVIDSDANIILLPLVGQIEVNGNQVSPGNVYVGSLKRGSVLRLVNTYEDLQANYLQLNMEGNALEMELYNFDVSTGKNHLKTLINQQGLKIQIGLFDARKETVYTPNSEKSEIIGFVIQGAFEFQNMLLEDRDSARIFSADEKIEFESLSENALILIVELKQ